jgi:uroporphyrin-III C-methyltransferase
MGTTTQPIANPSADTLVYYMGRKDAAMIAQQLIAQGKNHTEDTPVQILEAVSTSKERQWESNLGSLAQGKADNWFDSNSPALIMVGEALRSKQSTTTESQSFSTEINDRLQDGEILTNGRRRA